MPQTFSRQGILDGTTPVLLYGKPDTGTLLVREFFLHNADTVANEIRVYTSSGVDITIWKGTLGVGETLQLAHHDVIMLNTSTDLYGVMTGPHSTTAPTWKVGVAYDTLA